MGRGLAQSGSPSTNKRAQSRGSGFCTPRAILFVWAIRPMYGRPHPVERYWETLRFLSLLPSRDPYPGYLDELAIEGEVEARERISQLQAQILSHGRSPG